MFVSFSVLEQVLRTENNDYKTFSVKNNLFSSYFSQGNFEEYNYFLTNKVSSSFHLTLFTLGGGGHIVPALTLTDYNF